VGFDDSPAAALATPSLTTIAQPHEEKGRLAAEWLLQEIAERRPRRRRRKAILETQLVVRGSSGPPPRARSRKAK
jgi:DNA-binding LacI/PurR family transcriptional regulator